MKELIRVFILAIVVLLEPVTGLSFGLLMVGLFAWRYSVPRALGYAIVIGLLLDIGLLRQLGTTELFLIGSVFIWRLIKFQFGDYPYLVLPISMILLDVLYHFSWGMELQPRLHLGLALLVVPGLLFLGRLSPSEGVYLKTR